MTRAKVRIESNSDEILEQLALLERAASASVEFRERLAHLGKLSLDVLDVHDEGGPALGANTARIRFELPKAFRELVAVAAREVDGGIRE